MFHPHHVTVVLVAPSDVPGRPRPLLPSDDALPSRMDATVVTLQRGVHASPNLFPPRFARTAHNDNDLDLDAGTNDPLPLGVTLRHLVVVIIQARGTGTKTDTTDLAGRVAPHWRDGIGRAQTHRGRYELG